MLVPCGPQELALHLLKANPVWVPAEAPLSSHTPTKNWAFPETPCFSMFHRDVCHLTNKPLSNAVKRCSMKCDEGGQPMDSGVLDLGKWQRYLQMGLFGHMVIVCNIKSMTPWVNTKGRILFQEYTVKCGIGLDMKQKDPTET